MIEVKNLHKSFGKLEVLKGITETINDKEVVCVIGPSGSGKSTFIRCLNLLEEPTEGEVFLDSEKINALCRERHSLLGWILVALGLYMLYERIIQRLASFLWQFEYLNWLYELLVYDVPRLVVTFGIIALGVWFIRGPRKADSAEEIPVFVPPVSAPLTEEPPAVEKEEAEHGDE